MLRPELRVKTSSTIDNLYYLFPCDRHVRVYPPTDEPKGTKLTDLCKLSLPDYGLTLLFDDDTVTYFAYSDKIAGSEARERITPLWNYINFKTFLDYNILDYPPSSIVDLVSEAPEVQNVHFNLGRIVEKRAENELGAFYHDVEPYQLTLERQAIESFMDALNYELYLAISYYLMGCATDLYFLIEFYKSVEVIKNYFGQEKEAKAQLASYSFDWEDYKKLTRDANDLEKPLNIGRHAPTKGVKLSYVNTKRLLENPKSKELFEGCSNTCRSMIEAFIKYLNSNKVPTVYNETR